METGSEMIVQMLRRSYFAVDGLWFMMLEEDEGTDRTLQFDERVWRVMPKIQARKARELLGSFENTPEALMRCMALKFAAEGHHYQASCANPTEATIVISKCPWREILTKSGREHLSPQIAARICAVEAAGWAEEFSPEDGPAIEAEMSEALCGGGECCRYVFRVSDDDTAEE